MRADDAQLTWLPVAAAVRLPFLQSPRPGKKTHLSTVYRWVRSGKVRAYKRGCWLFVCVENLEALVRPVVPRRRGAGPPPAGAPQTSEWARRVLDEAGI